MGPRPRRPRRQNTGPRQKLDGRRFPGASRRLLSGSVPASRSQPAVQATHCILTCPVCDEIVADVAVADDITLPQTLRAIMLIVLIVKRRRRSRARRRHQLQQWRCQSGDRRRPQCSGQGVEAAGSSAFSFLCFLPSPVYVVVEPSPTVCDRYKTIGIASRVLLAQLARRRPSKKEAGRARRGALAWQPLRNRNAS